MSEPSTMLEYGHRPSRRIAFARVMVRLTLLLLVILGIRLAYKHMPPISTEGYRVCTSCGRYEETTTSWFGVTHGAKARQGQFLERWLANQGTPCLHAWKAATTSKRYFLIVESETGHFRGIRPVYIDSEMSVHQLTDDDVRELLRLDKTGKGLEFYTLLAELRVTRPRRGVPTTVPTLPVTMPSGNP